MRNRVLGWATALALTSILAGGAAAQPPDRRGDPPPGPGRNVERAVDDLKLSESKRETTLAAAGAYQENVRRLMELARSELLLKMKEVLSPEEFKKFREAADGFPGGPGRGPGRGRALTADDVVERIMSFDKNNDGKVTKDELPERMQHLIARGDTNKDGALDKEEIKKLAAELRDEAFVRGGGPGGRRFGPGGRGGPGGPGGGPPPGFIERAVDDLKLTDKKKEAAAAAVKAHQENVRKLTELARADLRLKLMDVLSEEEFQKIKEALDRPPGFGFRFGGPPPDRFRPDRP
jgi:hypothetical protein